MVAGFTLSAVKEKSKIDQDPIDSLSSLLGSAVDARNAIQKLDHIYYY